MRVAVSDKLSILFALGLAACSGGIPDDAKTTVLSFQNLDCSSCGNDMARAMIEVDGVHKTKFDKRAAELTVVADPEVDVFAVAQKNKPAKEEWSLVLGAGKGQYIDWKKPFEGADVKEIAKDGEDVADITAHLVKDKVTIFDFSAKWCEPCRELDEHILSILEVRKDVAYRKLDVGDWDTPLGKHYMTGVGQLPYVIVYDKAGKKVDAISGLDKKRLEAAIEKGGSSAAPPPSATNP